MNQLLIDYSQKYTTEEPFILKNLRVETINNFKGHNMLSGHYQGRLLSMLSCLLQPQCVLEIGTYTGYSALCLAEGLHPNGVLHTIDKDVSLKNFVEKFFTIAGVKNKIMYHIGIAKEVIPNLNLEQIDLVFIDANKKDYPLYYDLVFDKVRSGGLIIVDNVLWKGQVLEESCGGIVANIKKFNNKILADTRVEKILLPIRDGLYLVRKL